jgi:exodeoxyribonuclease V beta subunit
VRVLGRASCRAVLYVGPVDDGPEARRAGVGYARSALAAFVRGDADVETADAVDAGAGMDDAEVLALRASLMASAEAVGAVWLGDWHDPERLRPVAWKGGNELPELPVEQFPRGGVGEPWRRESVTGLLGARVGHIAPAPSDAAANDDQDVEAAPVPEPSDVAADASDVPWSAVSGGRGAAEWVHSVLERLSFVTGQPIDREQTLEALVCQRGQACGIFDPTRREGLSALLPGVLTTPLGAALGGLRLADVEDADRLDEFRFDFSVGRSEQDRIHGRRVFEAIGAARDDDPMPPGYLAHVRSMNARPLQGAFVGAIDLVLRANCGGHTQWFVVDYKTNLLGPRADGRLLRSAPDHYAQPWLRAEIARKHYYVQYMFYLVALHRYLRTRLPAYDYDRDMGGALYLFVGGMLGPGTGSVDGRTHGVFHDKPPRHVIERIDRVLAGQGE